MIADIVICLNRRLSAGIDQEILIIRKERTSLDNRASVLFQHIFDIEHNRTVCITLVTCGVRINFPFISEIFKMFGQNRFIITDRIHIRSRILHGYDKFFIIITGHQRITQYQKMRLDMFRHITVAVLSIRIYFYLMMLCDTPEIQVFCTHLLKHFGKWINSSEKGIIKQYDLIILLQFFKSKIKETFPVTAYIKTMICSYQNFI